MRDITLLLVVALVPKPTAAGCNLGTLASHLAGVTKHYCTGIEKNDCKKSGFPSAKGTCSIECAKTLEPFWDSCADVLASLRMIPPGMPTFYDTCMATLYPPGKCGPRCDLHTFHCRQVSSGTTCTASANPVA